MGGGGGGGGLIRRFFSISRSLSLHRGRGAEKNEVERTGKTDNYKDSINHHHYHHDRITGLSRFLSVQAGGWGLRGRGGGGGERPIPAPTY